MELANVSRFIGVRHRVKQTADNEARPTQVAMLVVSTGKIMLIDLENEDAELDFVRCVLPVEYRAVKNEEDISAFLARHIRWKSLKKDEALPDGVPTKHVREIKGITQYAVKVPTAYDGLRAGDAVAMVLGGSGNYLAYALSRKGEEVGAKVYRVPAYELKTARKGESDDKTKNRDASLLIELLSTRPELFHETTARDRALIVLTQKFMLRQDAMKATVACAQRLRQRSIGTVFCSPDGIYPEGGVAKQFEELIANDVIYAALRSEQERLLKELEDTLEQIPLYTEVLSKVTGVGPAIAGRLVVSIGDIRRFATDAKLKKFCGVHVLPDGTFARRRVGQLCNWHTEARQGLYLVADQFNRRKNSPWGKKLLQNKARLRKKHPKPIQVDKGHGKLVTRYTDGHIHKMATWRTLSQFVRWIYQQGMRLENNQPLNHDPYVPDALEPSTTISEVPFESVAA